MTDTYEQRAEMIRQMLQTYGAEINPDRIKGYLTVLYSIPAPARLAIRSPRCWTDSAWSRASSSS